MYIHIHLNVLSCLHARAHTGKLSDPNLGPEVHVVLTRTNGNKTSFKLGWESVHERYKKKYHKEYKVEHEEKMMDVDDD